MGKIDKKLKGGRKGKIAEEKFRNWLKTRKYKILGKEFETSSHSGGWPDFLVKRNGKFHFFEVKSGHHRVDPHQIEVLSILKKIGPVHIMRLDNSMQRFREETPIELK